MVTTKAQRKALKRVFDRDPLFDLQSYRPDKTVVWCNRRFSDDAAAMGYGPKTYRQFRKTAIASYGCIMIPWCGMWLGIESDGYTHS